MNQLGIFERKGVAVVSSRDVARGFEKRHDNVLKDIENIKSKTNALNFEEVKFAKLNFEPSEYKDNKGEKRPEYLLTRDGLTLLVMGYTGEKAMNF